MTTDRLPLFRDLARDWRAAADGLRDCGVPEDDPALGVWREAAWCHVLFGRGQSDAALMSLRAVVRNVTGKLPPPSPPPMNEAVALSAAGDLFAQLRSWVFAHHPRAFDRSADA